MCCTGLGKAGGKIRWQPLDVGVARLPKPVNTFNSPFSDVKK